MASFTSAALLVFEVGVQVVPVYAGFSQHPGTSWTPKEVWTTPVSNSTGHLLTFANSEGLCQGSGATVFPCKTDFRDPNDAWSLGEKWLFVGCYACLWCMFILTVHLWPRLLGACSRLRVRAAEQGEGVGMTASGALPLLEVEETQTCEGPKPDYPKDRRVYELFEAKAREKPGAVALVVPGTQSSQPREITYREFDMACDEVADALLSVGVTCGSVVGLVLHRSVAQVVATFGVLKSGAAFLPVDPEAPLARKQFLANESEASVVIGIQGDKEIVELAASAVSRPYYMHLLADGIVGPKELRRPRVDRQQPSSVSRKNSAVSRSNSVVSQGEPVERQRPTEDDMALIVYTSGTTGAPKGIVYDQTHLMHGVYFFGWQCEMSENSVGLLKSPYFWAVIEWEMFPALTLGGKLIIASAAGHKSPEYLATTINTNKVTTLMITPQVLDLVLDIHEAQRAAKPLRSLTHIVTVGEPLNSSLANRTMQMLPSVGMHNFYGASESSCTVYTVPKDGVDLNVFPSKAPAGRPQPHSKVYVMRADQLPPTPDQEESGEDGDIRLTPVPVGQRGEICFGGVLAACYWKHDDLTAQKWIETAEYGTLYRTGDLGQWRAGQLEVVGRVDRQVKIRGVRVEPEEVEAVLKKYTVTAADEDDDSALTAEDGGRGAMGVRAALRDVAVVASAEPSELVSFVTQRIGITSVSEEGLRGHCQANLTPSYVPKFFVILDELPKLPNGKNDLAELRKVASLHVADAGEMVMDSLGQMKKLSKWAVFENAVIHRCYAFWMIGVLTDHYMRCAIDANSDGSYAPFCTILARSNVKPWTEILIRSFFGNDQDMFGFIMLGAYQDSRPNVAGGKPKVKLGLKDLFVFLVYMLMAMPLPQLMHYLFQGWAWPTFWGSDVQPVSFADMWGWTYMQRNSYTSDHRWYLLMVLQTRIFLQIGENLSCPGWLQGLLYFATCVVPLPEGSYAFDICEKRSYAPQYVLYVFSWLFRNFGSNTGDVDDVAGCPIMWNWVQWYGFFYVICYHYLRPLTDFVLKRVPDSLKNRTTAAAAFSCSQMIGVLMALFHYPNNVLEGGLTGDSAKWAPLEFSVDFIQPALVVIGMAALPLNLSWLGNTTLGCYVFHYYFKDQMGRWAWALCDAFAFDASGILPFLVLIGMCFLVASVVGPTGHFLLLSPTLVYPKIKRALRQRRRREPVVVPPAASACVAA